jgi:hypothetical protein
MRKHKNDASGPAENRTQKVETIEHQGNRPNPEWWQAPCGPPPEVSGSSDDPDWAMKQRTRKDRLSFLPIKAGSEIRLSNQPPVGPCNAIRPGAQPLAPKPSPFWL